MRKTKAEKRATKNKLKMRVSGKSVFKLKGIIEKKIQTVLKPPQKIK